MPSRASRRDDRSGKTRRKTPRSMFWYSCQAACRVEAAGQTYTLAPVDDTADICPHVAIRGLLHGRNHRIRAVPPHARKHRWRAAAGAPDLDHSGLRAHERKHYSTECQLPGAWSFRIAAASSHANSVPSRRDGEPPVAGKPIPGHQVDHPGGLTIRKLELMSSTT